MVAIGDIVAVKKHRGLWVVRAQDAGSLPKRRWDVMQERNDSATSHVAGEGDMTLVSRPEISVGDWFQHQGHDSRVLAVSAEAIRVTYSQRSEVAGGGFIKHNDCEATVPRAALVSENLREFL